jgi:hypothetical protein
MTPLGNITVTSDAYGMCCDVAVKHQRLEGELLGIVMCHPSNGVKLAKRQGVTASLFTDDDHAAVWLACERAARADESTLWAARAAMSNVGHSFRRKVCPLAVAYDEPGEWRMQALGLRFVVPPLVLCHAALLCVSRNTKDSVRAMRRAMERAA